MYRYAIHHSATIVAAHLAIFAVVAVCVGLAL